MVPGTADVVIIGGGIMGVSIAYHLVKSGARSVVLLERLGAFGNGSTAKASGGIRAQFTSEINIRLSIASVKMFEEFPKEVDPDVQFKQYGYLFLATTDREMAGFRRNVAFQRFLGLEVELATPQRIREIAPYVNLNGILGGTFCDRDGYGSPLDYVQGYARRAKQMGAKLFLETAAVGIDVQGSRVKGVRTTKGTISTPVVVNASGAHSAEIGRWVGVEIPIQPYRRQAYVTKPFRTPELDPARMPMTIDFHTGLYAHGESAGVLLGWSDPAEPPGFNEQTDPEFLEKLIERAVLRIPCLEKAEILRGWAGLYETTPDCHPILGEVPEVAGFTCAAGFSGHGFMHGPIAGKLIAELILAGKPSIDISCLSLSRFRNGKLLREENVI